jgi:hypothetical protein
MRWTGHVACMGHEGKITVGRARRRWENIKMDWIYLAQDRYQWRALVNTVMNLVLHKILSS